MFINIIAGDTICIITETSETKCSSLDMYDKWLGTLVVTQCVNGIVALHHQLLCFDNLNGSMTLTSWKSVRPKSSTLLPFFNIYLFTGRKKQGAKLRKIIGFPSENHLENSDFQSFFRVSENIINSRITFSLWVKCLHPGIGPCLFLGFLSETLVQNLGFHHQIWVPWKSGNPVISLPEKWSKDFCQLLQRSYQFRNQKMQKMRE